MTLPSSGTISLSQVNTELSKSSTATISMNDTDARALAEKTGSGNKIKMSDFYGKSSSGSTPPSPPSSVIQVNDPSGASNQGWNNINNILTVDGNFASSNIDNPNSGGDKSTKYLIGRNLGLNVPSGKTLTDLAFEFRIFANHTGDPPGTVQVRRVSMFNNTSQIGSIKSGPIISGSLATYTINGNSSFWGTTLTASLVNNSLFGLGLMARNFSGKGNYTVQYYWMRVTASW